MLLRALRAAAISVAARRAFPVSEIVDLVAPAHAASASRRLRAQSGLTHCSMGTRFRGVLNVRCRSKRQARSRPRPMSGTRPSRLRRSHRSDLPEAGEREIQSVRSRLEPAVAPPQDVRTVERRTALTTPPSSDALSRSSEGPARSLDPRVGLPHPMGRPVGLPERNPHRGIIVTRPPRDGSSPTTRCRVWRAALPAR